MATKWTITFKTVKDRTCVVSIGDSAYSGTPIALTPAPNAFSLSYQQGELFTPVQSETGYIRIIDNGLSGEQIDGIHPSGSFDRPVSVTIDGSLVWRGYVSADAYSTDFSAGPKVVEFPILGALDILSSVSMENDYTGLQTIGSFLLEVLDATGYSWTYIVYPLQMQRAGSWSDVPEMRLRLSRFNFLHVNSADNRSDSDWTPFIGDSYLTVLQEICRYFGWVASTNGDTLCLTSPDVDIATYYRISVSQLASYIEYGRTISKTSLSRSQLSLNWDGLNHRRSLSNGRKRITVRTELNGGSDVLPQIEFNGVEGYTGTVSMQNLPSPWETETVNGKLTILSVDDENVVMHKYNSYGQEITWREQTSGSGIEEPMAQLVRATTWLDSDHISNHSYRNLIRISADKSLNSPHLDSEVPMINILSRGFGAFPPGGAFTISANVYNSLASWVQQLDIFKDHYGYTQWSSFNNDLHVSLCVGSRFYNGAGGWSDNEIIFNVPAGAKDSEGQWMSLENRNQGTVIDQKTLDMPWDGASGYIIPITEALFGQMVLTIYNWQTNTPDQFGYDFTALFIGELDVRYWPKSTRHDTEGVRFSSLTGKSFQDDMDVQLRLTSAKDDRIGHALLWLGSEPVGNQVLSYFNARSYVHPEEWLLRTMVRCYQRTSKTLELEVEYQSAMDSYDYWTYDGKRYIVVGREIDLADEHMRLTVLSYE